jgi:hypothetical protein
VSIHAKAYGHSLRSPLRLAVSNAYAWAVGGGGTHLDTEQEGSFYSPSSLGMESTIAEDHLDVAHEEMGFRLVRQPINEAGGNKW